MIGSDRDNFQTPEITKPEKCCENLIKMQNKIVEFEFSDDKICLIELVKIKLVSVLIKRGSVFCRVLSYTIKKCKCFFNPKPFFGNPEGLKIAKDFQILVFLDSERF